MPATVLDTHPVSTVNAPILQPPWGRKTLIQVLSQYPQTARIGLRGNKETAHIGLGAKQPGASAAATCTSGPEFQEYTKSTRVCIYDTPEQPPHATKTAANRGLEAHGTHAGHT